MRTFLDAGAGVTILVTLYAVAGLFVSLPDTNPYTHNAFPGSLLVFPIIFLFFYCLRSAIRSRRWYWFVGCLFLWPLSSIYYILEGRREFGHGAQQAVQADGPASGGSAA